MDYSKEQYYRMQQMLASQKKPFYMTYPVASLYMTEMEYEKDMERMKELYPSEAKKILEYVEEECDRMEYEGSMMFDEYPDRLLLRRICDRVYQKVSGPDEMNSAMPSGVQNLIEVLLYNEMYKRRCRYKRCRRWW